MEDMEAIADEIETILRRVLAEADAVKPAPDRYFMMGSRNKDEHWILGFAFKTKKDLRSALENGVCYQLHSFVLQVFAQSEQLGSLNSYIVFDYGESPPAGPGQRQLHEKFISQLNALQQEIEDGEFVNCGVCGHSANDHVMMGHGEDEESAPREGWMICPDEECTCFRTWSLGGATADS